MGCCDLCRHAGPCNGSSPCCRSCATGDCDCGCKPRVLIVDVGGKPTTAENCGTYFPSVVEGTPAIPIPVSLWERAMGRIATAKEPVAASASVARPSTVKSRSVPVEPSGALNNPDAVRAAAAAVAGRPSGTPAVTRASGNAATETVPIYQRGWFVPAVGVVGIGAAAAVAYMLTRSRMPSDCKEAASRLGLRASASMDDIKKAHRLLALKNHPDRGGSHDAMKEINRARDILMSAQCAR